MQKSGGVAAAPKPGRRETNKLEKLARIRAAARDVFHRKGFEAATLREIAASADVAFGTLFLYAKDKQDLLFLLFEDDLASLGERAFLKARSDMPFVEQLVAYFSEFYAFFLKTPQLSKDMLREITFCASLVATRLWDGVQSQERQIARLLAEGQALGRVSSDVDPDVAAHIIFTLHRVQLRFCLDEAKPNVAANLNKLRRQFEVLFNGLEVRNVAARRRTVVPLSKSAQLRPVGKRTTSRMAS